MDFSLPPLFAGLVSFILIFLVLANNRKTKIIIPYIFLNLSISLWNISLYFLYKSYKIHFFQHILAISTMFIFSTLFHFIIIFTKQYNKKFNRYLLYIGYMLSLFFIYIHFKYKILSDSLKKFCWGYYPTVNIGDIIYTTVFLFYTFYMVILLLRLIKNSSGLKRNQYKYIVFSILLGYIGSLTNFFPIFHIDFYPLGNLTSIFLIFSISYILIIVKMINPGYFFKKLFNFILIISIFSSLYLIALKILFKSHIITSFLLFYTYMTIFFTYLFLKILNTKYLSIITTQNDKQSKLLTRFVKFYPLKSKSVLSIEEVLSSLLKSMPIIFQVKKIFIKFYEHEKFIQGANYYNKKSYLNNNIDIEIKPASADIFFKYFENTDKIISVDEYDEKINKGLNVESEETDIIKKMKSGGYELGIYVGKKESIRGYILLSEKINGDMFDKYEQDSLITLKHSINILLLNIKNIEMIKQQANQINDEIEKRNKLETIRLLAGGVAHDFNNYLSTISTNIFLAAKNLPKCNDIKETAEILIEAQNALEQATELTKQLLVFSKDTIKNKKIISPGKLLENITNFVLRGTNIDKFIDIQSDLWSCEADVTQFNEVINNIIINAVQSMPDGGKISIKAENSVLKKNEVGLLKEGDYIKISLSDTGKGIPQKNLKKIFDPYFTTKKTGSGIGLAVSYSIIKNHKGTIIVDSVLNKGTTFYIYIPAVKDVIKKEPVKQEEKNKTSNKRKGNILIMDDNILILKSSQRLFKHLGYKVTLSKNSKETIDLYSKALEDGEKFDIVILDLTIPGGLGGVETAKKLLKIDSTVKCILSSGKIDNSNSSNMYEKIGFKGILNKPYKIKEIITLFDKLLN